MYLRTVQLGAPDIVPILSRPRVLIVDDYPGARYRRMRLLLDDGGFDVAEESLGREALSRLGRERFDLLVIDLHLPDISGLDVCRRAHEHAGYETVPVLLMSAVSETDEATRLAAEAGATAFVPDSADGDTFVGAVRKALG
jgi:CheY-like chemotaxis protein